MKNALWTNIFSHWKSADNETVITLKQVPVFHGLKDREYREIEKLIHERNFKPGETVFKKDATGEGMFVILSGKVEISMETADAEKSVLAELSDGEFFGELSLLDDDIRSATATATLHSRLLVFFRPDLFSLLERNPELGNKILLNLARVIGTRLRKTNDLLIRDQKG